MPNILRWKVVTPHSPKIQFFHLIDDCICNGMVEASLVRMSKDDRYSHWGYSFSSAGTFNYAEWTRFN